ncbi:SpoIIE family protein phosphatase [Streptomyces sp. NPDC057654]|uniref:SpoIIE family protein phosphatase n=1 Tax=Streptomyces sp. NPDC057654 TaxID=3346196 RepID=UPI0036A466C1
MAPTARTRLPGNSLAPLAGRQFVRAAVAEWTALALPGVRGITDRLTEDAVLLVSELVTNAVVHAGTSVELRVALDGGDGGRGGGRLSSLCVEVTDYHPARVLRARPPCDIDDELPRTGHGLRLVAECAESWGTTYHRTSKTVWFRLPVVPGAQPPPEAATAGDQALLRDLRVAEILAPAPRRSADGPADPDWISHGALSFLAEASELLAGQFDEDMVASLAAQLLVPRLADWCAVWLDTDGHVPRLSRVWHTSESRIETLRLTLEKDPPRPPAAALGSAVSWPWPGEPGAYGPGGSALACRLVAGGRGVGTILLGRAGLTRTPDEVVGLIEDFARRVALALASARQYTRQLTISQVLQRGLLPRRLADIPGVEHAVVYEPRGDTCAGGDFYDVFQAAEGRWCFALGDVCGSGPEAAVVTGLVRPWMRLLAKEGYGVGEVLDRLNRMLGEDAVEGAVGAVGAVATATESGPAGPVEAPDDGGPDSGARFLSLVYGELAPLGPGLGVRCTLACAGHPLPLLLGPDGTVRPAAGSQMLLGVMEEAAYVSETFDLAPGDTLLCVTDGVTEHRRGPEQPDLFDDHDGLTTVLEGCAGLSAGGVAERIRRAVHDFGTTPPDDDLALLVLRAQ